jgi:hypothetical protein
MTAPMVAANRLGGPAVGRLATETAGRIHRCTNRAIGLAEGLRGPQREVDGEDGIEPPGRRDQGDDADDEDDGGDEPDGHVVDHGGEARGTHPNIIDCIRHAYASRSSSGPGIR